MIKYIDIIISLFAGLVIGIISIVMKDSVYILLTKLLCTIGVFYIIGLFVRKYLHRVIADIDAARAKQLNEMREEINELSEETTDEIDEEEYNDDELERLESANI